MKCPQCSSPTSVLETRDKNNDYRRRRKCDSCGHRFTTVERMAVKPTDIKRMIVADEPVYRDGRPRLEDEVVSAIIATEGRRAAIFDHRRVKLLEEDPEMTDDEIRRELWGY